MREIIKFETLEVEIWRRPRQRRMYLTVREDGRVRVTCNRGVSKSTVLRFVTENRSFVAANTPGPAPARLSGDELLYLGRLVPLTLTWTWETRARVEIGTAGVEMMTPVGMGAFERERALLHSFRTRGRDHLLRRTAELAEETRLRPQSIRVRGPSSRWGSCTSRGTLSLNWKLIAAPPVVIDYVIFHELAHLRHLDHSPAFWALVAHLDPHFRIAQDWLRTHQRAVNAQFAVRHAGARSTP